MAGRVESLRKLRRLESRAGDVAASISRLEEQRRWHVFEEAVARLDDDTLAALDGVISAAIEGGSSAAIEEAQPATTTNLYSYAADQRELRAVRSLALALDAAVGKDKELVRGERHA